METNQEILTINNQNCKYYVYRLVDPRTGHTFYVGKGCGERAKQHIDDVTALLSANEDLISLKQQQIAEIIAENKQVIILIHRSGLTESEAFEVEAALIDAYPGLTNIQNGHGSDRGLTTYDDYLAKTKLQEYTEPDEDYVIIKVKQDYVYSRGSVYDAVREAWRVDLNRIQNYKYVLGVVDGVVREVFEVTQWYQVNPTRVGFTGYVTNNANLLSLRGKMIPAIYRKQGSANPVQYKKITNP